MEEVDSKYVPSATGRMMGKMIATPVQFVAAQIIF
jgi:hypothetical protein